MRSMISLSILLALLPPVRVIDARPHAAAPAAIASSPSVARPDDASFAIKKVPPQHYLGVRDTLKRAMVPARAQALIAELERYLDLNGGESSGPPFTRYVTMGGSTVQIEVCVPVTGAVEESDRFRNGLLAGGRVACAAHMGAYDGLPEIYRQLGNWITGKGLEPNGGPWEIYLNQPSEVSDPSELLTEIHWPLK